MTIGWCFDNTYFKLSKPFKEDIKPIPVKKPELVLLNKNYLIVFIVPFLPVTSTVTVLYKK